MRRLLVLTLGAALAAAVFADDALVLPTGVIRARVTGAYTMAKERFDADGEKVDLAVPFPGPIGVKTADSLTAFNIGAAVEFGVADGINVAAQWIPGYILFSEFDADNLLQYAAVKGALDLFVGAKVQILGDQGFIKNEAFRFAAATGALVPISMPATDWEDEAKSLVNDAFFGGTEAFQLQDADRRAWGLGGRAYFDYVVNKMVFVNLYGEFIKFLKVEKKSLASPTAKQEYDYGYKLTLEVEPHFEMPVAQGTVFKAGLPLTYVTTPEIEVDGTGKADSETTSLAIRPNVALFTRALGLPLEIEVGYLYPLMGKNVTANSAFAFQLKSYIPTPLMKQAAKK